MIHRNDPNCILSQIAASAESLLAWKLGPGNQRSSEQAGQDKAISRSPLPSVEKAVGTLACTGSGVVSKNGHGVAGCVFSFSFNGVTASFRYVYSN
jgi:hypothetical protein